mmetsp:Transcript_9290/g.10270  ORF Transcript_9290/g.10270 Transcript_9290/m.10270 type:complete len:174 (-) Transcript_9290:81-602(-)
MGNTASSKASIEEQGDSSTELTSGFFLADGLQSKIMQEFQSKLLQDEWEKHQKYVIAKGNKRRLEEFQTKEYIVQKLNEFRPQNDLQQSQLDQRIDELRAKFSDITTASKFDAARLHERMTSQKIFAGETPCLIDRTNVTLCLSENHGKESNKCNDFITALENCAQRTIVTKH